ncbi:bifunctional UDP-sugar hydrolase/5'-nucleotidase [Pseudomonas sp. RL]|uniref:bifunctional metallophosphatase/5'-nucleotidase n=1 Tax=Pseudomonas sp. RL TaxID=1452718 RepID=UPI00048419B8|nr:bifunctional UDP-sugar hydrolase/5'-nucleotidase [Pseudomonas sp. RL]
MRIIGSLLALACLMASLASGAAERRFVVLHTNDWQSRLLGYGPNSEYSPDSLNDDQTVGGVARLATLLHERRAALAEVPLLTLDAGDFSMGTLFHTVAREEGGELRLLGALGYDATTLGNHEFDFRPAGLAQMIAAAERAGDAPNVPILASNIRFSAQSADDDALEALQRAGRIQPYRIVEKGGLRFGLFGLMGRDAVEVSPLMAPVTFADPLAAARDMVRLLREQERVDVVILLSHMGVSAQPDGSWRGEDVELVEQVPGIDLVIGAHSHSLLREPLRVNDTTLVQVGSEIQYLGELHMTLDAQGRARVAEYRLHAIDDRTPGDPAIGQRVAALQQAVSERVLAAHGYAFDQPLARVERTLTRAYDDPVLGNLVTDALRRGAGSDIAFTGNGTLRDELYRGREGVQSVADLFRVAPLGIGEFDDQPGYPLMRVYFTPREIRQILEVLLLAYQMRDSDSYYPRVSGVKFTYNPWRMPFDRVSRIWLGDAERGYRELDPDAPGLISLGATSYVGSFTWLIPELTYGLFEVVPKDAEGRPLAQIRDAMLDRDPDAPGIQEYKEWQAFLDHVAALPARDAQGLALLTDQGAAAEQRMLRVASLAPSELFRHAGGLQWTATLLCALLLWLAGWLTWRLWRRVRAG